MDLGAISIDSNVKKNKVQALKTYLAKCKMLCSANAANDIENLINEHVCVGEIWDNSNIISFVELEWYWEDGEGLTTKMLIRLARYFEDGIVWLDNQPRCYIRDGKLYNIVTKHSTGKLLMLTKEHKVRKRKDKKIGIILFEGE